MSIYQLKPKFQALLRPLVQSLAASGVTANQVTLCAMLMSIGYGLLLGGLQQSWVYALLPLVLFIRMALNAIDGMLAREHHQQSKLGALLNEIGDVVSDLALYLPLFCLTPVPSWLSTLTICAMFLTEFAGILPQVIGAKRNYVGPLGKSDRAFWFSILSLAMSFNVIPLSTLFWNITHGMIIVLCAYTSWRRLSLGLKEVACN